MTASDLEAYLRSRIPVAAFMSVRALEAGPSKVVLAAPLEPNVNHRGTMFGGSESALALLTAWSLLRARLGGLEGDGYIVVQRNATEYLRPIRDAAVATCYGPSSWEAFDDILASRGRARIDLEVEVTSGGETAGRLEGTFVAFR